jgi:hypothetical protein
MKFFLLFVILSSAVYSDIGIITKHNGTFGEINRDQDILKTSLNFSIFSNDIVNTKNNTILQIDFIDKTNVRITENSRLVIDDFIFDPYKNENNKIGMRVSMGTVRYTSGLITKANSRQTNINSPSANITVRGTDFHVSVDEAGQTLVVLVPNEKNYVGQIDVSNSAGTITLIQPYSATYVTNYNTLASEPVSITLMAIDPRITFDSLITNELMISPPENILKQQNKSSEESEKEENEIITQLRTLISNSIDENFNTNDNQKQNKNQIKNFIIEKEMDAFIFLIKETEEKHIVKIKESIDANLQLNITHDLIKSNLKRGVAPENGNTINIIQRR